MKHQPYFTDQFFAIFALWQVVGVGSYIIGELLPIYVMGMLALIVIAYLDFKSLLKPAHIQCSFNGTDSLVLGEEAYFAIILEFISKTPFRPKKVFWCEPSVHQLKFENSKALLEKKKHTNGRIDFMAIHKAKAIKLGFFNIKKAQLTSISGWGFWTNDLEVKVKDFELRVYPPQGEMSHGEFVDRISNQTLFLNGVRQVARGRSADQFYSVRKYQYPDPRRHIDAKKTAKYNELMTRTYEEHRSHHLILALDCSRILMGSINGSQKVDYYLSACLKLAEQAFSHGDKVSFMAFSDHIHYTLQEAKSSRELYDLYRGHSAIAPTWNEPSYELLPLTVNQVSKTRAMVFVMTDPSMPIVHKHMVRQLLPLCSRHMVLVVGLSEKDRHLEPYVEELSSHELSFNTYSRLIYNLELEKNLKLMQSQLSTRGGGALRAQPSELLDLSRKSYDFLRDSLYL